MNLRKQTPVIGMWVGDDYAQEARVTAVCQSADITKSDIVGVRGGYWPAHIEHKANASGIQLDAIAPDFGGSAMDARTHRRAVYRVCQRTFKCGYDRIRTQLPLPKESIWGCLART